MANLLKRFEKKADAYRFMDRLDELGMDDCWDYEFEAEQEFVNYDTVVDIGSNPVGCWEDSDGTSWFSGLGDDGRHGNWRVIFVVEGKTRKAAVAMRLIEGEFECF